VKGTAMKPNLYIVRGLPGSGKSTFAASVENNFNKCTTLYDPTKELIVHLEADQYFIDEFEEYKFRPENLGRAHEWCLTLAKSYLKRRYSVIVSNTFTTMKELKPYLALSEELDVAYKVYRCTGDYGSVHNVPLGTLNKMADRFVPFEGEILVC
jgi:predicted kinase